MQEQIKRNIIYGVTTRVEEEENFSLVGKGNKSKGKKAQGKSESSQNQGKKKDLNKIKCFYCHEYENYETKHSYKKSGKKHIGGEGGDSLSSQFELDFTLIACMEITVQGSVRYLDFGASFHMTWTKEFFNSLEEKDLQLQIELGDDGWYSTKWISTITFKSESSPHIHLKNVMYVLGLKNILIYVVVLEDRGYDVVFSKGKSYLKHVATRQVKPIGVRVNNLYKLEVDACVALRSKAERVQSRYVG